MWKIRRKFWHKFQDVTLPSRKQLFTQSFINIDRLGPLLDKKEINQVDQNVVCSATENG